MALEKEIIVKTIPYKYWVLFEKFYNKALNKTQFALAGFPTKEARELSLENKCSDFAPRYEADGDLTTEQCYTYAKQSLLVKQVTKEAEPAQIKVILDENNNLIGEEVLVEAKPEEFEMVETNPLVNAINV